MKKFLLVIIFAYAVFLLSVMSQTNIQIYKSNGQTETYADSDIESITFTPKYYNPVISEVQPNSGKIGDTIRISGKSFGESRKSYVTIASARATDYLLWSDTLISAVIPPNAKTGKLKVVIGYENESNKMDFTINEKTNFINTSISGRVVDEDNNPICNASVFAHDSTTKTDANGLFIFENIIVPVDRCFIVCRKSGYFDMSRAAIPGTESSTEIRITMMKKNNIKIVNSEEGGTIEINDSSNIVFQKNGFVKEDGTEYTGEVNIASRFIKPNDSLFNNHFPGDIMGKGQEGAIVQLTSYGFFPVDLESPSGEKLELKKGFSAEISFQAFSEIPDSLNSIPSWYFDYKTGMWIEDDVFTRTGDKFIAHANHFSYYNCDWRPPIYIAPPLPPKIGGKVISCNDNERLPGMKINIGQIQVTSDNFGNFKATVNPNTSISVTAASPYKSNVVNINLRAGDSIYVVLTIESLPVIKGKIVNCDNVPIPKMVFARWGKNGFASTFSKDGKFSLAVEPNVNITLESGTISMKLSPMKPCYVNNIGNMKMCGGQSNSIIDMSLIPAGTFRMGDIPDEQPLHKVTLTRNFYMSKYEITQAQWKAVLGTNNPSLNKGDSLPVENITWLEATEYCNYLSDMEGLKRCYSYDNNYRVCDFSASGYRLPTEAEWEYACRAGTETDFYSGNITNKECTPLDSNLDIIAWYCGNSNNTTNAVGQKKPNFWGLYDMNGNVAEWVWDTYYSYQSIDQTDPNSGEKTFYNGNKIVRGGSANAGIYEAKDCRSASRKSYTNVYKANFIGFRVVRSN
jgi:formylglycine-generating enzyme required for sulfatase activity